MIDHGPVFAIGLLYLDPGSGSFIIQLLLGAGMGLLVAIKLYWAKIKGVFKRGRAEAGPPDPDAEDD